MAGRVSGIEEKLEKLQIPDDEMVNHMYETVLHHNGDFGKALQTHLFYMVDGQTHACFTNEQKSGENQHAEELLVKELEKMTFEPDPKFNAKSDILTVFISNSPCSSKDHNCAKKLKDFLMKWQNVSLSLYVTHLYKNLRVSCETHRHRIDDDFYANTCGLWNLMHHERCEIKPFNMTVWKELLNIEQFGFSPEVKEKLLGDYDQKRDYYTKNGTKDGTNDRSRKEEDRLIEEDLKAIGIQILKLLLEIKDPSRDFKQTCLVCSITAGESIFKFAKSDQWDKHAEELLLEELVDLGIKDQNLTITIFMNDTPCSLDRHNCAWKFIQYLETAKVDLTLYVTSLCKAKKETCTQKDKSGNIIHQDCSKTDEPAYKAGLASLKQYCTVKSPSRDAWEKLFDIMNLSKNDQIITDFWKKYEKQENDRIERKEDDVI